MGVQSAVMCHAKGILNSNESLKGGSFIVQYTTCKSTKEGNLASVQRIRCKGRVSRVNR